MQYHNTVGHPLQDYNLIIHPLQDHSAFIPMQDHIMIHCTEDLKNTFPESFNKKGNMPGEYSHHTKSHIPTNAIQNVHSPHRS